MTLPTKPVVIRLSAEGTRAFDELCGEFAGLAKGQVMRMLVEALLSQPMSEQIETVTKQIRKPSGKKGQPKKVSGRLENSNQNRRHARE